MTGVRPDWRGVTPEPRQRIYFANHASHGDFVLIWSVLPKELRDRTRPVAGADYWREGRIKPFLGAKVFRAVLIERVAENRTEDPVAVMTAALDAGDSLIVFPEGTRNMTDEPLLPFKSGIYNLAMARPEIELILCSVTFGAPLALENGEDRRAFLERARAALLALGEDAASTPSPSGASYAVHAA
jgi:1-acyl-sn-glycerol-3-phosphate acyltransferase